MFVFLFTLDPVFIILILVNDKTQIFFNELLSMFFFTIVQSTNHSIISGLKYEKENEDDLKDKQDFEKEAPSHYPPNGKSTFVIVCSNIQNCSY